MDGPIYRVIVSPEAAAELQDIQSSLTLHAGSMVAQRLVNEIAQAIAQLDQMPHRYPPYAEGGPGVHGRTVKNRWVVAYEIEGDQVTVLNIYDGRQARRGRF